MLIVRSTATFPAVTAAILAGGRASRFGGADKSSLLVDGTRIVDRQRAALSTVAKEILIIGHDPARYAGLGVAVIGDVVAGAGPIGGIYTALLSAQHPWVIALACDLPFVSAPLFELLARATGRDVDAVVPRSAFGLEPLCAIYARSVAAVFKRRLDGGARRLGDVLEQLRVREITADRLAGLDEDGRLFENVNTPHDYARAREMTQKR
jgi:molybdopterin-guanine dinucleotide biosynthesis protein A